MISLVDLRGAMLLNFFLAGVSPDSCLPFLSQICSWVTESDQANGQQTGREIPLTLGGLDYLTLSCRSLQSNPDKTASCKLFLALGGG